MQSTFTIHPRGTVFLRFILSDGTGNYWTGTNWTPKEDEAILYGTDVEASMDITRLLLKEQNSRQAQIFQAPVTITAWSSGEPVSTPALQEWLAKFARLLLVPGEHGPDNSICLMRVDWSQLSEVFYGSPVR